MHTSKQGGIREEIWEELGLCINQKAIFTKKEKFLSICRRIAYTVISWLSK
jgi:hypothetical protein